MGASFDQNAWVTDYWSGDWWHDWWFDSSWDDYADYYPVVLDLDGDAVEITPLTSSNTFFDIAGDGYQHRRLGRRGRRDARLRANNSIDLKENNYGQTFIDGSTIDGPTTFIYAIPVPVVANDGKGCLRLFNEYFLKLLAAAGYRRGLGGLLFAAILVGSFTSAGAAETYKAGEGAAECSNYASIEERSWTRRIGIARLIQQELDRKYNDSLGRFEYNLKSALLNDYAATREDTAELTSLRYFLRSFSDRIAIKEYSIYVFGNGRYEIWIYIERIGCIYSIDNSYVLSKSTL